MKTGKRLRQILLVCSLLLVCVLSISSCDDQERTNFVVKSTELCSCEAAIRSDCGVVAGNWKFTVNELEEVSAHDFSSNDYVGAKCQGETTAAWEWPLVNFNSWQPVSGFKYNMAGRLHHFDWTPYNFHDDEDWNLYVVPDPKFQFLIKDVIANQDNEDDIIRCGDNLACMGAEISPDKSFWNNGWFFLPSSSAHPIDTNGSGYSWLEGRKMGFYGPWIMDANHGSRPEIHPVEMMWFKDHFDTGAGGSPVPFDVFWLFFIQDNTGRFDDEDNFDCGASTPSGWRPWAHSPLSGQFNVAFEVDPRQDTVNFFISEVASRFVMTAADASARQDADDGVSHALEVNGKVVVRVQEDQPDDHLGVTFTNLCLGTDGKLRGFVTIKSKIGRDDDRDEEGYQVLRVSRTVATRPDVAPPKHDFPVMLFDEEEVGGSLEGNENYFTGDLQITLLGSDRTTDRDYEISKIEFAAPNIRRELQFDQNTQDKKVLIRGLPLVQDGVFTLTSASGLVSTRHTMTLVPLPGMKDEIARSSIDASAGRFLSAAVGGIPGAALPKDKKLSALEEIHLKFHPRYAPYLGDEVITDGRSSFASEINEAIAKNEQKKLEKLFGSAQPFTLAWTFEATDLATGNPVPVYTDKTDSEGVQIEFVSDSRPKDTLKIKFASPGAGRIVELRAKATITDTRGKTRVLEHRVWSHGFQSKGKDVKDWLPLIQALSGLKDKAEIGVPERKPQEFSLIPDIKTRRAYLLNASMQEALRDRQISVGELRDILRGLKTLR